MRNEFKKVKLNLRHFDGNLNVQTTTTSGGYTGNSLTAEMKTFYDKNLIRMAKPNLVHDQFAQTRNIPKNGGKMIEFRKFDSLPKALKPLTEGVTPDGNKLNVTAITSEIHQYGDYITLSDLLELSAIDPVQTETQELLAEQAGRTLDSITRDVITAGTNVQYVGGASSRVNLAAASSNYKLTVEEVQKAIRTLKAQNAKPAKDGYFVAIIHPDVSYDLTRDPEWVEASKYAGSEQLFSGEIGKIRGCRFVETTEAKIVKETGKSVYCTMVIGANAYGTTKIEGGGLEYIVTQLGSGGSADPLKQRATMGWKATKTAERLVEQYMVRIESKSTFASEAN